MDRVLIAAAIVVVAVAVAARRPPPPARPADAAQRPGAERSSTAPTSPAPMRRGSSSVFTSATCHTCADVVAKAEVLASDDVAVDHAEWQTRRDVHERYRIDGVPLLVIADGDGVVRRSFAGPVSATDLWAAVAAARDELEP